MSLVDCRGEHLRLSQLELLAAAMLFGATLAPCQPTIDLRPILELEKRVYLVDESVRFWIGATSANPIPEPLRSSGMVHWIRPDGSKLDEPVHGPMDGGPIDGDPASGWKGGWGFGRQAQLLGRYTVSFEYAGRRTPPETFDLIPNPFASGITAEWVFADIKSGGGVHAHSAVLRVENRTGLVLRFAKPGLIRSEVSLDVTTLQPLSRASLFVQELALLQPEEIPSESIDKLDWSNQSKWPMIVVAPGGKVDRTVDLTSSFSFQDTRAYEVTIRNVLTIFLGSPDDSEAALFPIRMPLSATAHFR